MRKLLRTIKDSYPIPFLEDEPDEEYMERFIMADNLKIKEEFVWHPKRKF